MRIDGDAAPVVVDRDRVVGVDDYRDPIAIPTQRLIDRVVDDFEAEVVKAALRRGPDVHAGPLSNRFKTFENLDLSRVVLLLFGLAGLRGHDRPVSVSDTPYRARKCLPGTTPRI